MDYPPGTEAVYCFQCMTVTPCKYERVSYEYQTWTCTLCGSLADDDIIIRDDDYGDDGLGNCGAYQRWGLLGGRR